MKNFMIVIALFISMSSFAGEVVLKIPASLNLDTVKKPMDVYQIQRLINEAGELAKVECKYRDAEALEEIAKQITRLIRPHAGHSQFQVALAAQQRIAYKSFQARICQQAQRR